MGEREILIAVVITTPHGVNRETIEEATTESISPLWFMDHGTITAVHVIEKDMDPDEKEEGVSQIEKFFEQAI